MPLRKDKVFLIAFEFPPYKGGIANYSQSFAKCLVRNGYEVEVMTLNACSSSAEYDIYRPRWRYQPDQYILLLRKVISVIYRIYQYFFFIKIIARLSLYKTRKAVVITSLFFDFSRKAVKFFRTKKIDYQIVLHGLDIYELPVKHSLFFEPAVRGAQKVIFNSVFTEDLFHSTFFVPAEEQVIPPLLDTSAIDQINLINRDELKKKFGVQPDIKILVSICRLVYRKGIDIAIQAVSRYLRERSEYTYLIAGDGAELEKLRQIVPDDLRERILFLGAVSDQVKFSLLRYASVFLMPNRDLHNDVEGFGISFIEASYMKTWVIGGSSGGVPEAVDIHSNGFLIDPGEKAPDQVYRALLKIEGSNHELLERGRQFVIRNFSLDHELTL